MSKTVIKIENLSKIYRLGEVRTGTLSHDFNRWVRMNLPALKMQFNSVSLDKILQLWKQ